MPIDYHKLIKDYTLRRKAFAEKRAEENNSTSPLYSEMMEAFQQRWTDVMFCNIFDAMMNELGDERFEEIVKRTIKETEDTLPHSLQNVERNEVEELFFDS